MTDILRPLYILLGLLSFLLLLEGRSLLQMLPLKKRRHWARVKVPRRKGITCRVIEPSSCTGEFPVDDISPAGLCFLSDRKIERQIVRLSIRFPFTTFKDAATVWAKIVYSGRCAGGLWRTGIAYLKKTPGRGRE